MRASLRKKTADGQKVTIKQYRFLCSVSFLNYNCGCPIVCSLNYIICKRAQKTPSALSRRNDKRLKRSPAHYLFGDKTAPLHFHIFHLAPLAAFWRAGWKYPIEHNSRRRRHFIPQLYTQGPISAEGMRKTSASFSSSLLSAITCCCQE